jgi:hypothetical protein
MKNIRSIINSLKARIRSVEENLGDIKNKCVDAHCKVVKELKSVHACEEEFHELLSFCLNCSSSTLNIRDEIRKSETQMITQEDMYRLEDDRNNQRWS